MQTQAVPDIGAAILREGGSHLDNVLTATIFLASLDDFSGRNESYAAAFKLPSSARSTIEICRGPSGMPLETESIAPAERNTP